MSKTIPSWSISRWQVFEQCQYRAKLQWLDNIPDMQPKPSADRGTKIHLDAENFVLGKGDLTHELRHFAADLKALRAHADAGRVTVEEEWAFDSHWHATEWKSGWLRLKADATCRVSPRRLVVVDYKSGKRFGNELKHAVQLQLYALCALLLHQDVEEVVCELWYVDHNELADFTMRRGQLEKYLRYFDSRGRKLTETTEFKPNPNVIACKYCPYHADRQGDCQYGHVVSKGRLVRPETNLVAPANMKVDPLFSAELDQFKNRV